MLSHEDDIIMDSENLSSTSSTSIFGVTTSIISSISSRFLQDETTAYDGNVIDGEEAENKTPLAIFSAVMSNLLLFFLIFGLSATVNLKDLQHQITNKFAIGSGVAMQFIIMPLLGFVAIMLFHNNEFTQPMAISLLVVTASPGGSYSNWWCSLFNAELALSVAMTSVSSLLSIGLLPANLMLYGWLAYGVVLGEEDVNLVASLDFGAIFISLGVVMGAILGGLYVGYQHDSPKFHERANHFGSICGIALILFSAFLGSGAGGAETNFWSLPWSFYVGTAFPCVIGMSLANIVSRSLRLTRPETVAISIECCYQNTAIATSVAVTMFSDPTERAEAVSVPLFYGVVEAVIIGIYCLWAWKVGWTKAPADEKVCTILGFFASNSLYGGVSHFTFIFFLSLAASDLCRHDENL
jgi:predicted Na+-dependent transporter